MDNKRIAKYARDFTDALLAGKVHAPSGGDCWYCLFKTQEGQTMGDAFEDHEHIVHHVEENYYVPSLLANAMREHPPSPMAQNMVSIIWSSGEWQINPALDDLLVKQIRSSIRKYVARRVNTAKQEA